MHPRGPDDRRRRGIDTVLGAVDLEAGEIGMGCRESPRRRHVPEVDDQRASGRREKYRAGRAGKTGQVLKVRKMVSSSASSDATRICSRARACRRA